MYKALVSFCGKITMRKGETRDLEKSVGDALVRDGLVEKVAETKKPAATKKK